PANNSPQITTTVTPGADLSITAAGPSSVATGTNVTFTLTVSNSASSSPATGVQVVDTLPAGLAYVSATPSQGSCLQSSSTITCDLLGLAAGTSATVTVVAAASTTGPFTTNATVTGNQPDPNAANNAASATVAVGAAGSTDLAIPGPATAPLVAGGSLTYTLTATNNGSSPATGVVVSDSLPGTVSFVSANASQGSCIQVSGTVSCVLGSLSVGASATVTIVVTTPPGEATLTDTA